MKLCRYLYLRLYRLRRVVMSGSMMPLATELDEKTLIKYVKQYYKKMEEEYDENKIQLG